MRTSNPALNQNTFAELAHARPTGATMTVQGAINKTGFLVLLLFAAAAYTWHIYSTGGVAAVQPWMIGGLIAGLVLFLITMFSKTAAPVTAPLYAIAEGFLLGGLSAIVEVELKLPGIVTQAVGLTLGVLVCMLIAYSTGIVRATAKFRAGVVAATGAICLLYLVNMLLHLFGHGVPFIHEASPIGIGFSVVVVIIAALNLVLDFDFVERGAQMGAPKVMEWYAAFGLLVTLVWLYIEILRLLMKLRRR